MLATRVRVSPCSDLCSVESLGRFTLITPSSVDTAMSAGRVRDRVPLGPFTVTVAPSIATETPFGRATGRFPMRDIASPLPDDGEQLAAQVGAACLAIGHQSARRRDDRDAESVLDSRQVAALDVAAETR